jgi:hypothetical protein
LPARAYPRLSVTPLSHVQSAHPESEDHRASERAYRKPRKGILAMNETTERANADALANAIEHLGAVEVAPGRYARREAPVVPYEIISEAILRQYAPEAIATFGHRDRQFCGIVTMPPWWTPEQRFAWRTSDGRRVVPDASQRTPGTMRKLGWERITADLQTGAEVPASITVAYKPEAPTITTTCGCSATDGACAAHKAQNAIVSEVADTVTEAGEHRPAYMRFVTTSGERFAKIESVDASSVPPRFKVGPLMDRSELPNNAGVFELAPVAE